MEGTGCSSRDKHVKTSLLLLHCCCFLGLLSTYTSYFHQGRDSIELDNCLFLARQNKIENWDSVTESGAVGLAGWRLSLSAWAHRDMSNREALSSSWLGMENLLTKCWNFFWKPVTSNCSCSVDCTNELVQPVPLCGSWYLAVDLIVSGFKEPFCSSGQCSLQWLYIKEGK